jgi:hypothetical protein
LGKISSLAAEEAGFTTNGIQYSDIRHIWTSD